MHHSLFFRSPFYFPFSFFRLITFYPSSFFGFFLSPQLPSLISLHRLLYDPPLYLSRPLLCLLCPSNFQYLVLSIIHLVSLTSILPYCPVPFPAHHLSFTNFLSIFFSSLLWLPFYFQLSLSGIHCYILIQFLFSYSFCAISTSSLNITQPNIISVVNLLSTFSARYPFFFSPLGLMHYLFM